MPRYAAPIAALASMLVFLGCGGPAEQDEGGLETSDAGAVNAGILPATTDAGPGASQAVPSCASGETCPASLLCCAAPFGCAGKCVPDCRVAANTCPAQAPSCDPASGLCRPGADGGQLPSPPDGGFPPSPDGGLPPPHDGGFPPFHDGGQPPPHDGGPLPPLDGGMPSCGAGGACPGTGLVCCVAPLGCAGVCVPDCRVSGNSCPPFAPNCGASGLCSP